MGGPLSSGPARPSEGRELRPASPRAPDLTPDARFGTTIDPTTLTLTTRPPSSAQQRTEASPSTCPNVSTTPPAGSSSNTDSNYHDVDSTRPDLRAAGLDHLVTRTTTR